MPDTLANPSVYRGCPDCLQPEGAFHIVRHRGDHPISGRCCTPGIPHRWVNWEGALVGAVLIDIEGEPPDA